jgi:hypothetical protein
MNHQHNLLAFLLFIAMLFCFSGKAQTGSDTITIAESWFFGDKYYQNDVKMNLAQLVGISKCNPEVYRLIQKAQYLNLAAYCFTVPGGICVGFALGHAIVTNRINKPLFYSFIGAGIALIGVGIGFDLGAKKNIKQGIAIYNKTIKQNNNANIDLGLSANGVNLRLNF